MKTLWLVGMMGAGKSTLARLVAARLQVPALDADEEVERAAGARVAEIFAREGEAAFRARELRALQALAGRAAVVAVGGGALETPGALALLAGGVSVYLRASAECLLARLAATRGFEARPLLAKIEVPERAAHFRALLAAREKNYARADFSIDTDGRAPEQVADAILTAVQSQLQVAPAPAPGTKQ